MSEAKRDLCPECGQILPVGNGEGSCAACLMKQAMASRTLDGDVEAAVEPVLTPEEIAERFPQFDVTECLGRGGMGVVYKARQKSLDRWVAIKVLAPHREGEERFAERFEREAKTLAKMSHPNIVTVFDHGESDGLFYIVMEYVDGVNLRDLLREGKMEPEQALAIVPPICDALEYAHGKGVVHRDIKPENLLLDRDGKVKIADFGIASLVGVTGEKCGTPPYMAPEQSSGSVDRRADIYALGVVLYEMLTGERPAKDVVVPSKKVEVDVRIDEMVLRALEKEPERRYQTAGEFRTVVETVAAEPEPSRKNSPDVFQWFQSPRALKLAKTGWVLGCLGFLGFLGTIPILSWLKVLFGFFGFFGLIEVAIGVEIFDRSKKSIPGSAEKKANNARVIGVLIGAIMCITVLAIISYRGGNREFLGGIEFLIVLITMAAGVGGALWQLNQNKNGEKSSNEKVALIPDDSTIRWAIWLMIPVVVGIGFLILMQFERSDHSSAASDQYGRTYEVKGRNVEFGQDGYEKVVYVNFEILKFGPSSVSLNGYDLTYLKPSIRKIEIKHDEDGLQIRGDSEVIWPQARTSLKELSDPYYFSSVVELELPTSETLMDCFLDFDSGEILSAPRELVDELKSQGRLHEGGPQLSVIAAWARESGVDCFSKKGEEGLILLQGRTLASSVLDFHTVSAQRVFADMEMIAKIGAGVRVPDIEDLGFHMMIRPPVRGLPYSVFRTREGSAGVLEFMNVGENSEVIKIRYKLVRKRGKSEWCFWKSVTGHDFLVRTGHGRWRVTN